MDKEPNFWTAEPPQNLSITVLVHQVYSYVSEVYTTPELERKRRALHAIVDEVCDEINGSIERLHI